MTSGNSEQRGKTFVMPSAPPAERPRWLWPHRIPLGCLTLLAGEPQAGKSYLTLDLAARVSRGGSWPGESADGQETGVKLSGPGSVLMVCLEDSWHDTIRPRLGALCADLPKIRHVSLFGGGTPNDRLEWLREILREMNDCRLIVIDPISAFTNESGGTNGSQGRRLVYLLAECVSNRAIAMLLVTHLRASKGKALHLPSGSDALTRAARAAWFLGNDPVDPDRRLLLSIKNNLGPPPSGLTFTFQAVGDGQYARLQWEDEPVLVTADDFLRASSHPTPPRDHVLLSAVDWLRELLKDGRSVPAAEGHQLAKARGISYGTLRRAFRELGVESLRQPQDAEHPFIWHLDRRAEGD